MPIPRTDLDDRTFAMLVEQAVKSIPRHAPEWTAHHRQDPGVTFIELFAWLTEMQQYYLNQIGEANYRKFLKLLGERPAEATSAKTDVTFSLKEDVFRDVVIPKGTKLCTDDNIIFETEEPLLLTFAFLEQVSSSTAAGIRDNTDVNMPRRQPPFFAFGEQAEAGSKLYLGFGKRLFFTWEELPGAYSDRVREDLSRKPGLEWTKTARIQKSSDETTIYLARGDYRAKLIRKDGEHKIELTVNDELKDVFFAERGTDGLGVFLQPFSAGKPISLSFTLFEDYPVKPGSHGDEPVVVFPSASICWEYANCCNAWRPACHRVRLHRYAFPERPALFHCAHGHVAACDCRAPPNSSIGCEPPCWKPDMSCRRRSMQSCSTQSVRSKGIA